jgi:hypothetical protein
MVTSAIPSASAPMRSLAPTGALPQATRRCQAHRPAAACTRGANQRLRAGMPNACTASLSIMPRRGATRAVWASNTADGVPSAALTSQVTPGISSASASLAAAHLRPPTPLLDGPIRPLGTSGARRGMVSGRDLSGNGEHAGLREKMNRRGQDERPCARLILGFAEDGCHAL